MTMSEDTNTKQTARTTEKPRGKKIPKRISEDYLHNSGLYYLGRHAASSNHFRSVMLRKVRRSCMVHQDQNFEECAGLVDALVQKFERAGLLNDDLYLSSMISSLRRKGLSKRMIGQKLGAKGVAQSDIDDYLSRYDEERGNTDAPIDPELKAAAILCRRKKIGAFATAPSRDATEDAQKNSIEKNMARLGRAGFGFETSRKILSMTQEEIENIIYSQ